MLADQLREGMDLYEDEKKLLEKSGRGAASMTIAIAMEGVKEALQNAYPDADPGVIDGIVTHGIGKMMREVRGRFAAKQGNTQWGLKSKTYKSSR